MRTIRKLAGSIGLTLGLAVGHLLPVDSALAQSPPNPLLLSTQSRTAEEAGGDVRQAVQWSSDDSAASQSTQADYAAAPGAPSQVEQVGWRSTAGCSGCNPVGYSTRPGPCFSPGLCPPYMYGGAGSVPPGTDPEHVMSAGASYESLWGKVHTPIRYYAELNYISMRLEGSRTPPLVTTSPAGTALTPSGLLPAATILFGRTDKLGDEPRDALEARIGYWLVDGQFLGIEGYYTLIDDSNTNFHADSGTYPILAVPFLNGVGAEARDIVAHPNFNAGGARTGSVDVNFDSDYESGGMNLRHILWADFERNVRIDFIGGYRFVRLDENLTVQQQFFTPGAGVVAESNSVIIDSFDADNEFHGGEFGLSGQWLCGRWTLDVLAKVAMGNNHQSVTVDGSNTETVVGGGVFTTPGGTLTQPANIGRFTDDQFTVMPEGWLKLQYQLTDHLRLTGGYRASLINDVVRPGDQINRMRTPAFNSTTTWMQGIDAGVILEY
jgi:hypothetical protein